jgi:hypothetical protein
MRKFLFLLTFFVVSIYGCNDELKNSTSNKLFVSGTITEIQQATSGANGLKLTLRTLNDKSIHAYISDTTKKKILKSAKQVMFKLKESEEQIQIQKIISLDNQNFELNSKLISKTPNQGGYYAKLKVNEEMFNLNFSISTIGKSYKEYNVGDSVSIKGKLWVSNDELLITVNKINN